MAEDAFHLTRELLWSLHAEGRSSADLVAVVISHLFELCPTCAHEFEAFRTRVQAEAEGPSGNAVERVAAHSLKLQPRVEKEKKQAEPLVLELLSLPQAERLEGVRRDASPYRGPALAYLLLQASRDRFSARPHEALELAELAQAVIVKEETSSLSLEIYARAMAYAGNAKRVCGEPRSATGDFEQARFLLQTIGGGDRSVQAEIDSLEGSLRRALRDYPTARNFFQRAARVYEQEGDSKQASLNWLNLSITHREAGSLLEAIQLAEKALDCMESSFDHHLLMIARHALMDTLADAQRFPEARNLLEQNRDLYLEHADPTSLLRLAWVEGKIARGLGDLDGAEAHFLAARNGFQQAGIAYDMALVSLELAGVYLQQGRAEEVKSLAMEMVAEFQRQQVGREVLSAVILFQESAKLEQLTLAWLQRLIHYLPRAQRDPQHVFEQAS